jgi:hypothetical protein
MQTAPLQFRVAFEPRKANSGLFKFCITSKGLKEEEKWLDEKRFAVTLTETDPFDHVQEEQQISVTWKLDKQGFFGRLKVKFVF